MWDDLEACSACGAPATVLFGGGSGDGDEVERAACEGCRDQVMADVMRAAFGLGSL